MNAHMKCRRCGQPLAVIDWDAPVSPVIADRIVAAHAVTCLPPRKVRAKCAVPGCGRVAKARGWCGMHWTRWKRHGDPLAVNAPTDRVVEAPEPQRGVPRLALVPPEPVVTVRKGKSPAVCHDCGKPYAAQDDLPPSLLAVALYEHKRRCKGAA